MEPRNKLCSRKATWLAFGLIALTGCISAQDAPTSDSYLQTAYVRGLAPINEFDSTDQPSLQGVGDATGSGLQPTPSDNTAITTKQPPVIKSRHFLALTTF